MDLSKVKLLEAIEWFKQQNYSLQNGGKGYENCHCHNDCSFHILYVPNRIPKHREKPKKNNEFGYIMTSHKTIYDLYVTLGIMHNEREYKSIGIFKDNYNITRHNVKGMNHFVKLGENSIKNKN